MIHLFTVNKDERDRRAGKVAAAKARIAKAEQQRRDDKVARLAKADKKRKGKS